MKTDIKQFVFRIISLTIITVISISGPLLSAYASNIPDGPLIEVSADDYMIVVSLGDSYSSGEGIEPFYGQESPLHKTENKDWLAHRSAKSWPSKLVIPGYEGASGNNTMGDYKYDLEVSANRSGLTLQSLQNNCVWYFVASSGAKTAHINTEKQDKPVRQLGVNNHQKFTKKLPTQLSVMEKIKGTVDLVTISIGGNDVNFPEIIATCALRSTYLGSNKLEKDLAGLRENLGTTRDAIKNTYKDIANAAPNANIIVAGYPQLLDPSGKGAVISEKEAGLVNSNVSYFNDELEKIVEELKTEGKKIHFVDVEGKFQHHEAYSTDPWINNIILGHAAQELDDKAVKSSYSIHPNEKGAEAYAECVNETIRKIFNTFGLNTLAVGPDSGVVAIKKDGTVQFQAMNDSIAGTYKEIKSWEKVISIAYGWNYIVALKEDGTLNVSISSNGLKTDYGQCNIEDWRDIRQVVTSMDHTVGLKSDGTVEAVGNNEYGQCDVSNWTDIVMIAAGDNHTIGLKENGTVVATGKSGGYCDPCAVEDWTDIKQVVTGYDFTAGLCSDGTIKTTHIDAQGFYPHGKPEDWTNVKSIAAGGGSTHLLALRDDGSVIGIGPIDHGFGPEFLDVEKWSDIVLLSCACGYSVGVTKEGTVLAAGILGNMTLENLQDVRVN